MNKTQKKLSEAGKRGQENRMITINKTRLELLTELSKHVDKKLLDYIQISKTRWSNPDLNKLIKHYKKP